MLCAGQFRDYTDDAIFRLRLLSQFVGTPRGVQWLPAPNGLRMGSWLNYVLSYAAYQARRERRTLSFAGRAYRAAQALCQEDGEASEEAIAACLRSLLRLAACCRPEILLEAPDPQSPRECTDAELRADIDVAALYLGRAAHVERLVAEGVVFIGSPDKPGLKSGVFGPALHAAADSGNLELVKLVLARIPRYDGAPRCAGKFYEHRCILFRAAKCGHRALFHFALDGMLTPPPPGATGEPHQYTGGSVASLERALSTPWPDNFERVATLAGSQCNRLNPRRGGGDSRWLSRSADSGKVEMVRHFLGKLAAGNSDTGPGREAFQDAVKRALSRAVDGRHEIITKMLLDAGVDLTQQQLSRLLRVAVWKCSIPIAKMLLDRGADPNDEQPPHIAIAVLKEHLAMFRLLREHGARLDTLETGGWAMAAARQRGLDSMVDLLVREGADKDVVVDRPTGGFELRLLGNNTRLHWALE
jgi:hypothetical protein